MTAAQSESLVSKIVEKNVQLLMNEFSLDLESAFAFIYKTKVFESLNAPDTGLRARSADYIYELVREEYLAKNMEYLKGGIDELNSGKVVVKTMEELEAASV